MNDDYQDGLRTERHDAARELEQDRIAADADLLDAAKTLRAAEMAGHWDDKAWWDAIYRVRDIADRRADMDRP